MTCPDCIELIIKIHTIKEEELMPEYANEFMAKQYTKAFNKDDAD